MSLIECPECKKEISDKAENCPNCGLPKQYFNPSKNTNSNTKEDFDYKEIKGVLINFSDNWRSMFSAVRYIAKSKEKYFLNEYSKYIEMLCNPLAQRYIQNNHQNIGFDYSQVQKFLNCMNKLHSRIDGHNEKYIEDTLVREKDYFDNMLKTVDPNVHLDDEQRRAIVTDEDYCLLVAGAGAGKTTTMAAKVKYLIEKQGVAQSDIIVISYTNKAIDELKERIQKKLNFSGVNICTFHSFGYDILRKTNETPPIVNIWPHKIIYDCIENYVYTNNDLLRKLVLFLGYYFDIPDEAFTFNNLNDYCDYRASKDLETLKSRVGDYNETIIVDRSRKQRTILGEYLRSQQEVQIANFLYIHGLEYIYEKPYPYTMPNATKIYTPDFYIKQGENECWIEHFGVTQQYQNALYSNEQLNRYTHAITNKRQFHKQNKTKLVETYSKYDDGRELIKHLEEELGKHDFKLNPRSDEEIYKKLTDTAKDKYVYKLVDFLVEFIEKYKTRGYNENEFKVMRIKQNNVRTEMFLDIAEEVYKYYNGVLREKNQIDFADMINDAEKMLLEIAKSNYKPSYKYIIIDEFQDIAKQRFNLTKALVNVTDAKVVAVGDDWQSIYAFAGSDITLFTKFLELIGDGKEMQITHTYRNSQELIDIAGNFVQKNYTQIKKKLVSPKSLLNPIKVLGYEEESGKTLSNWGDTVERAIDEIVSEFGEKTSILMIGRYNFDSAKLTKYGPFELIAEDKIKSKKYPNIKITFLTAHSSKGLGFDNVIILNMKDDKFGFPSQIENDPIIKLVRVSDDSEISYPEERRLFYVAMTRTKNRVYMIAPNKRSSHFVLELISDYNIPHDKTISDIILEDKSILRCPVCGAKLKYENNKNYGLPLYMCTNDPEMCDFMTNKKDVLANIFKCPECSDGFMIVKYSQKNNGYFYGCTNYDNKERRCKNMKPIPDKLKNIHIPSE
jgi:DNA helicase-4